MPEALVIDAVRTPRGKRKGSLAGVHSVDLAAHVLAAAVERSGVPAERVEDVVLGCVTQIGEQAFDEFRDCDDVLAPVLELMLIRDYIWLPIEQVTELEISRPERPRDLLWTPVRVGLVDGTQRRAYMPARYVDSYRHEDDLIKLARATDWIATDGGPVTGVGMRQFLAGDEACAMLELEDVAFDARTA